MVFESLVVDILNKFLGDYVENLDRSQLKIGIWGGDVSLKNLSLKPSALDELNLPVKTVYGHLGKLVLKIPWKNIYTAPVEVSVENLFLLVNPIRDIVYNPEKEEKLKQEIKQSLINKVEVAKKTEKEIDTAKVDGTFVEKLAAQIIKNVQVFIENIHIRYEDRITKPEHPFSVGVTLHTLTLHTTNECCDRYILPQETSPIFYKKMVMEGLSVYWNTNSKLFASYEINEENILNDFLNGISCRSQAAVDYLSILGPINSEAKMQINSKPEMMNFITPKIFLSLVLDQLFIHLSRSQYQYLISLVETFDRMAKGSLYRKYRPNLKEYKGHYKEWWKFAISSILEEDIKRKFRNWDWNVISSHRKLCRAYQQAFRAKLTQRPTDQITKELTRLELELDAFNIILLRQKVENEVERDGSGVVEQKRSKKGWFGAWFSSAKVEEAELKEGGKADIAKKFENVMTVDEKKRLYKAIDYHEAASPMMYPTTFVAIRMEYILRLLRIDIEDDYSVQMEDKSLVPSVLCIEFTNALVAIQQRPTAQSFSFSITMQSFQTFGLPQNDIVPRLIKSKLSSASDDSVSFLNIFFETNPEDENYDQRLHVTLKPLKVVYDAQTVIRILEFFTPEKDISTVKDQLQIAANTKLEEMKEKSVMRLQYAIEKSIRLDLKIDLMAPYLLIPFGGFYTKNESSLVINLGRITVESKSNGTVHNVKKLFADGRSRDDILNQMMSQCYDHFLLSLGDVQMLTLNAGESWKPLNAGTNILIHNYILHPTSISIDIFKCVIDDDPRLPKIKIDGSLPDVTIQITEKKILEVVALVLSVPLPQKTTSVDEKIEFDVKDDSSMYDSTASLRQKLESFNKFQFPKLRKSLRTSDQSSDDQLDNYDESVSVMDLINVEVNFYWKALTMYVQCENVDSPLIEASVSGLELKYVQRLYSLDITTKLGNISLTQNYANSIVPAITTPVGQDTTEHCLFACKLLMAEKNSPMFDKMYNSTGILVEIDFAKLYIVAHQEAILSVLQWVNKVHVQIISLIESHKKDNKPPHAIKRTNLTKQRRNSVSSNVSASDTRHKKLPKPKSALGVILEDQLSDISSSKCKESKKIEYEIIDLKLTVRLNVIQMCLQTASRPLATMDIDGFNASVLIKKFSTSVDTILQSVSVSDLNSETVYNKVAYISEGKDAMKFQILICNNENPRGSDFDIHFKLQMNCLQCVFINEFITDILDFMNNFQTSKQMIMDASAAAVASAKQNVQEVYQSSTTISLNIFADAPIIIVPQNNQSTEILVIDFGHLSVKNVLKKKSSDDSNREVIIDEIFTNLEHMKIARTNYERTAIEHVLLKPVNYTLIIKRNVSASWFSDIPTFDIDGSFCPIHVMIRDVDYEFLMDTISENIGSKPAHISSRPSTVSMETYPKFLFDDSMSRSKADEFESEVVIECTSTSTSEITTLLKFTMAVESVTIDLFSGSTDQFLDEGLARFTLSFLCVKGCLLTNADLSVHAFLSDCCVDDTRSCKAMNKVKRYMERKTVQEALSTPDLSGQWSSSFIAHNESTVNEATTSCGHEELTRSMIDVTFEQKSSQMHVNARVFSFIMILNVDHIMRIQEFFTPKNKVKSSASPISISVAKKNSPSIRAGNSDIDPAIETTLSVISCSVTIEKPDIILVENLDDINTNAMILNNEAKLFIQVSSDDRLGINGVLKNLQLYSCCYNPAKRSQTTALILHPVTVDLMGSASDSKGLHLDTKVSEIKISITAGTIGLLAKISSTLTPNVESNTEQNELHLNDYTNIWQQNAFAEDYWFLKSVEEGVDVAEIPPSELVPSVEGSSRLDIINVTAPRIEIMLEAGIGEKTIPLLALQSSFQGTVTSCQDSLILDSYISLEVGYYNSRLALWEPIIEPFLRPATNPFSTPCYEPWQMQLTIQLFNKAHDGSDIVGDNWHFNESSASNAERTASVLENQRRQSEMTMFVKSEERMELTFTKTCMDVVKTLIQSFNQAVNLKSSSNMSILRDAGFSSFTLVNDFGADVILRLKTDQVFKVFREDYNESVYENSGEHLTLKPGETINLLMKKPGIENERITSSNNKCLLEKFNTVTDRHIHFINLIIPERNKEVLLPVSKSDKRYFSLRAQDGNKGSEGISENWGLISEVDIVDGSVVTILRSVVRVFNHFSVELSVFYFKPGKNKNELIEAGKVGPSQILNLPVQAVYTTLGQLYFAPCRYFVCNEPFVWKNLQNNVSLSKEVHCISKSAENEDPFFIRILGEMEQVYHENTTSYTIASSTYNIHLRPALIFKNFIPIDIICCLQGVATEHVLKPGQRLNVSTAEPDRSSIIIRLDNYIDKVWSCKKIIKSVAPVFSVWTFTSSDNDKPMTLNLGVWYSNHEDSMIYALYCPFWMVNKTGLDLSYKGVDDDGMILQHPKHLDKPVLFSFKEKLFFSKKKSCVRINDGEWSDKLSIDAAGSSGSVSCLYNNQIYQLGIYIKLTSNSLTKQVIFSPFFTIFNNCPFAIEYREDKARNSTWITIPVHTCNPFWPVVQEDKDKSLELRICGTNEITPSFSYFTIKTYPLILLNKFGGIIADVQVTEGGIYIEISQFHPKFAPALIINDTESFVEFTEVDLHIKSLDNARENENAAGRCLQNQNLRFWQLQANKEVLFTWSCINADKPVLLINKNTSPIDLRKDGIGEFSKKEKKYWISFLNGMQRVLLLTTNEHILKEIEAVSDFDNIKQEIVISLEGIGFSLVNNSTRNELLYLSISSSGVIWEMQRKTGKRFKAVSVPFNDKLEKAYVKYSQLMKTSEDDIFANTVIDMGKQPNIVVNFATGTIFSPTTGNIRRIYSSGLWMEVRSSERYNQIHAKVNRLQVDNQIYDAVFPVILYPIPPPKSIAATSEDANGGGEKPFAELSIVERINEGAVLRQFKYFKVLVQEFHVKVDIGFINGLVKFFEAHNMNDEEEMNQFQQDEQINSQPLYQHITVVSKQDFYDLLHFSPLKIHISFSLAGENPNDGTPQQGIPVVNFLTQSIGVTLTDVNDVVFRLAYFERKHKFYSQSQILTEVQNHYVGQFVKQLYVLVLGLDVLGNPFGLVTGLKQGVEDFFYEPFQGAIQGPSEFAEGVLLGVRSLFGHTVGGAAGAVGRITGAMGKGIAALTLDDEYQRRRRQRLALHQQSLTDGGRGLVMGVVEGVGGVISKPISGAREEGVEGFVKGVGKGVVGLFMRPASGVVDFASGTVDVVRRVATCSEETRRYRLPRIIKENGLVEPFSKRDARGYKYLLDIEKGRFIKTDTYLFYVAMASGPHPEKEVLLITSSRVIYLIKSNDIFTNNIKIEWQYTWNEIRADDGVGETEDGLYIRTNIGDPLRPSSGGMFSIFKKSNKGKILIIPDIETRRLLLLKIKELVQKAHRRW